jgi:hypothetical protein
MMRSAPASSAEEYSMRYWLMAFAAALVVVGGYAIGPFGLLIAAVVFAAALFLLWAEQLGFGGAWTAFGFDRFDAPLSGAPSRDHLAVLVRDRDKVAKALTIALASTALWLILPEELVLVGGLVAIGASAQRIYARRIVAPAATTAQPQASPRAISTMPAPPPSPTSLASIDPQKPPPAALEATIEPIVQPLASAIVLAPVAPAEARAASSTATLSFMIRGTLSSASSLALLARGRYRKPRVRRSPKPPKRPSKSRTARKPTRHVPLHLKLPLGRRQIRRSKRPLQSGPKLASRQTRKSS